MYKTIKSGSYASTVNTTPLSQRRVSFGHALLIAVLGGIIAVVASSLSASASANTPCKTIQLKPGTSSTEISGSIAPDATECFRFTTGNGQTVHMAMKSAHNNTIFSILDLVDARDSYTFKSQKKTYEFIIAQLMKAASPDTYKLTLSIK